MVSSYRIASSQNQTVGWIYINCLTITTKRAVLFWSFFSGKMKIFTCIGVYCSLYHPRGKLKTIRQVVLIVIAEFLLFRITKKIKTQKKPAERPVKGINSTFFRFKRYGSTNTIIIIFWSTNFRWFMKTGRNTL